MKETKLWNKSKFSLPQFKEIRKDGHYTRGPHGGNSIYIHTTIPFSSKDLTTQLQAMASKVQLQVAVTMCNIYTSGSHVANQQRLTDLYNQLPQPFLLVEDFNAHHTMWGSERTHGRGREVEGFMLQQDLNIMNNGAPTRILYGVNAAIDSSPCTPQLKADFM